MHIAPRQHNVAAGMLVFGLQHRQRLLASPWAIHILWQHVHLVISVENPALLWSVIAALLFYTSNAGSYW